jgi:DNA-binding GntR family transcriptional regulator
MAGGPTRGERVYDALRADILAGRLTPGERLRFAALCARYDSSMGLLREALSRLEEQGLVRSERQQGYRVTPLSRDDLCQLTDARCEIEPLVLRRSIAEGDLAWESRLIAAHHTLARTPQQSPAEPTLLTEEWVVAHAAFHGATLDGCPNPRLLAIALGLRDAAELYRCWSGPLGGDTDRDIAGEHRALLEATLDRDPARASTVLIDHIRRTSDVLLHNATTNTAASD